jgi:hypothetical protein
MTTATETKPDTREKAVKGVLHFANAASLIRAISNGLLFAGSNGTLPMLTTIKFEFDGSVLTTIATDRYRLCVETVELDRGINHEGQPSFEFLLQRDDAKGALAALKANRRDTLMLVHHTDAAAVELRFYNSTVRYATDVDHTFPPYRSLIPELGTETERDRVGFTPAFLADLSKVQTDTKVNMVTIKFYGEEKAGSRKPTRIDYLDGPTVLLMPIKVEG